MMDKLRRFLVSVTGIAISIGVSVLVMIHGWGLDPKSWWWIVGVYFFGHLLGQLFVKAGMLNQEENNE